MIINSSPLAQVIVAELRAEIGRQMKTNREIAHMIGLAPETVSRKIKGQKKLTFDEFFDLCEALHLDPAVVIASAREGVSA